ncbi:MAG TPA: sulfatase-like hydrolase/transferase [Methanotrichaceae archaeon]|nr:sulfatase-like hydrolase/transferase [Methanotrichaceae archaeon]
MPIRSISQVDIAPTIARVLGLNLPNTDGEPIEMDCERCRSVILAIVDSLGYDLYLSLVPYLRFMPALASRGSLISTRSVSSRTTPAIASILSGLLPEHHQIYDKAGAKDSSLLSLPEIASAAGMRSAVIMEKRGAEVYTGLIEVVEGVPDELRPGEFDDQICQKSLDALALGPRLMVSYFIGLDKTAHMGLGMEAMRAEAKHIDGCLEEMAGAAGPGTLIIICGDHPVHAGPLKRNGGKSCVALISGRA